MSVKNIKIPTADEFDDVLKTIGAMYRTKCEPSKTKSNDPDTALIHMVSVLLTERADFSNDWINITLPCPLTGEYIMHMDGLLGSRGFSVYVRSDHTDTGWMHASPVNISREGKFKDIALSTGVVKVQDDKDKYIAQLEQQLKEERATKRQKYEGPMPNVLE